MKKRNKSAPVGSLDGFIAPNKAYQPVGKRQLLDNPGQMGDGFHPQRASDDELGQTHSSDGFVGSAPVAGLLEDGREDKPIILGEDVGKLPAKAKRLSKLRGLVPFRSRFGRKKDKRERSRRQKVLIWLARAIAAAIIIAAGYFGYKFWQTSHNVFHGGGSSAGLAMCHDMTKLKQEGDCRINILLLGTAGASSGNEAPDLTDTIMLASIDPINHTVGLLSIPRDLEAQMPNNFLGAYPKINGAYEAGKYAFLNREDASNSNSGAIKAGFAAIDKTVSSVIGLKINYNVLVNFKAFKEAVNDVGGIDVNIKSSDPRGLYDPSLDYTKGPNCCSLVDLSNGWHHLDGQQALDLARARGDSPGQYGFDNSDYTRTQDQRTVLAAIAKKVLSLGTFSNPARVSSLMSSFGSNVFTDLSLSDVSPLYDLASRIPSYDIVSLSLSNTPPNSLLTGGFAGGAEVQVPTAGPYNYSQIIQYVRPTLRDGELAHENASVAVYNATATAGLATDEASILRSYGYKVTFVGTAPNQTDPTSTAVIDLHDDHNPYTRHYLENRFKTISVTGLPSQFGITPPAGTDFVIILGQDASTTSATTPTAG